MGRIFTIAQNTFKEALRQKVLYVLIAFAMCLLLFSLFLGELTLGADTKMIKDLGLAAMMFFGVLISILVGIQIVFKEIERRTIYTLLSKPVSRGEFILGKYFGLIATLGVELVLMTLLLFGLLSLYPEKLDWNLLKSVLLIFCELCVLTSVVMLFSSYSSQLMTTLFSIAFLVVGHLTDDLSQMVEGKVQGFLYQTQSWVERFFGTGVLWGIEFFKSVNLDVFAIHSKIVHGVPIPMRWVMGGVYYGVCMVGVILSLAIVVFKKKDLQ